MTCTATPAATADTADTAQSAFRLHTQPRTPMLGWIFKKNTAATGSKASPAAAPAPAATLAAPTAPAVDWAQQLQAAQGDTDALLALARRSGVPAATQQAAIEAVTDEAALKRAERDWRGQDRRPHRLVKQRHLALVAAREAREQAARLIDGAEALLLESPIPTNRLVELDRQWRRLDATLIDPAQVERFDALQSKLTTITRERGDEALKVQRWINDANDALATLDRALNDAAIGPVPRDVLAAAATAVRAAADAAPEGDTVLPTRPTLEALQAALALALQFGNHLTLLDELLEAPADAAADRLARWQARAPLPVARLAQGLEQQAARWRDARAAERDKQRGEQRERQRGTTQALGEQLVAALEQGEAALAEGRLADTHRQLVAIDDHLAGAPAPNALAARIATLQAGYAQLKGWQHWAGGVARDELVLQAEALAAVSLGEASTGGIKLSVKQQAEVIDDMRARWKELDRLGGATSRALWQRFDGALKTAWLPVAEHQAQQRSAREQNLQARVALIEALDAVPLPDADITGAPDWKSVAAALDHLRTEWRKLGPIEHTVPNKARESLVQRLAASTARLETPLTEARRTAQAARERLIDQARHLADQAAAGHDGRDGVDRVRELQAEWQQQARTLSLARAAENALWADFKAAVDAVFSAREATFSARDAQLQAGAAERLALIERIEALDAALPDPEIKRALADADAQWQRAAAPPRQDAAALETRWRTARERWREHLAGSARRQWQAHCDALAELLARCDAADDSADPALARTDLRASWAAPGALPPPWAQALHRRLAAAEQAGGHAPQAVDDLLLRLEMAAGLASPAAHEEARRALKLQALKSTLEGRQAEVPAGAGRLLQELIERTGLDATQRERRAAIVAGLRAAEPLHPLG